ncbi:MAG: hypothetical protein DWH82_09860 [Planctomycetota bacterium]|nr:MAG: hypothetical protein DWH82_09860 [Planctomycetota bacterium]
MIPAGYMENPKMTGKSPVGPVPEDGSFSGDYSGVVSQVRSDGEPDLSISRRGALGAFGLLTMLPAPASPVIDSNPLFNYNTNDKFSYLVITGTDFGTDPGITIGPGAFVYQDKKLLDSNTNSWVIRLKYNKSPIPGSSVLPSQAANLARDKISITVKNKLSGKTSPPVQFDCMVFIWA